MKKRLKRIEVIIIGIIVLVFINLTVSIVSILSQKKEQVSENLKENKYLPFDVTRQFTNKNIFKIKIDYNQNDWVNLYDILGDYAKSSIKLEQVESQFDNLSIITGKIEKYSYSHYEYIGFDEGAEWFNIYYKCRFSNGHGKIQLNIRSAEGISEITGFHINLEEME